MIKYFRRIRQKLLRENRFSKYLLYAVGEIVLVVIGILIALQINNSNEKRKAIIKEKNSVVSIYQDLKRDLGNIEKNIEKLTYQYNTSLEALDALKSKKLTTSDSIALTGQIGWDISEIIPIERKENTWDALKVQGVETFIIVDSVKVILNNFYGAYDLQIERFNQLPKKVRQDLRELTGYCHDALSARGIFKNGIKSYGDFSPALRHCVISNEKIPELIAVISVSSIVNIKLQQELKTEAESAISFLEDQFDFLH